jgi:hypothetical protein
MDRISTGNYAPGIALRRVGGAVVKGQPYIRLPLGVDDQRGAEEQRRKGEKDEK